ncbi:hypothetical protein GmHk_07G019196 [Glycine max]|nr:hypothetical protein GmHk_07G019196 [Glycine max]
MEDVVADSQGFPSRSQDTLVLTSYIDHVAAKVWEGKEHTELKLASHGRKVKKLGRLAPKIEGLVAGTSLSSLITCSFDTGQGTFVCFCLSSLITNRFSVEELSCTECNASTNSKGAHIEVRSGYSSSRSLLLRVTLPHISRSSNRLNMAFISWVMRTSSADKLWSEKLNLHQNIWTVSSGMLPTTYLASSHAHGTTMSNSHNASTMRTFNASIIHLL